MLLFPPGIARSSRAGFRGCRWAGRAGRAACRGLAGKGGLVCDGKSEESGEAERVCAGQRGLQVAAGDFRTNIDAEDRLNRGPPRSGLVRLGGEIGGELFLIPGLVCGLPARERLVGFVGGAGGRFRFPCGFHFKAFAEGRVEGGIVGEADRKQLQQAGVFIPAQRIFADEILDVACSRNFPRAGGERNRRGRHPSD